MEIIVTTFMAGQERTIPIWMPSEVWPRNRPGTSVMAMLVMRVPFALILLAYYFTRGSEAVAGSGK